MKSNVTRGIQKPASLWEGAGAGQQDVTLGSSLADEGRDRVWDGTQSEGQGSCGCLGWIPEGSLHPSLQAGQERAEH